VGETVVTEGGDRLREGAQVLLPSPAGAPPAAASKAPGAPGAPRSGSGGQHRRNHGKPQQPQQQ
jgi:multidrug efflux system membrane fusion protein